MIQKDVLDRAVQEAITLQMKAVDIVMKEVVEPIADVGPPEEVLGKPYEMWSTQDFQLAAAIYGQGDSPLSRLIFRKKLAQVEALRQEVV